MIARSKCYVGAQATKGTLALLALGLWLFSFSCLMPRAVLANMPQPTVAPDYYLVGVNKIIVSANTTLDPEYIKYEINEHKIPNLDFHALNQSIADKIRTSLPESLESKIKVQAIQDTPLHSGQNKDESALILHLAFGYHVTQLGNRQVVLGAVYPTVERLPPKTSVADRVSGFHANFINGHSPAPFLLDGDDATVKQSVAQATDRCTEAFIKWLATMPLEKPE